MTLRNKITLGAILIILLSFTAVALVTGLYMNKVYLNQVQIRIRHDLFSAHRIYTGYVVRVDEILRAVAVRRRMSGPLEKELEGDLGKVFRNIYRNSRLDVLTLVDIDGRVLYRAHNPAVRGDVIAGHPLVRKVMETWEPASGTVIVPAGMLAGDGEAISARACIKILPTPRAGKSSREEEDRGMFIAAAVPFYSLHDTGRLGILLGGYLLNRNDEIVDGIRDEVFGSIQYPEKEIGTATVFFDDLRIATNVTFDGRQRAIGSRLSEEVYDHVVRDGKTWSDRAFVVNNWYISSYEPIRDIDDRIVGSLYVGVLEAPYRQPQKVLVLSILLIISLSAVAAFLLVYFYMKRIMKPIDGLVLMCKRLKQGDLSVRCELEATGEMGLLCRSFDQMADAFEKFEKNLVRETQLQIGQSEKLAAIGRLAAGVAHEINNPLTSILNFTYLVKQSTQNDEGVQRDLNVIIEETGRVRRIVRELLDFARQAPAVKENIDLNAVLKNLVALIVKQREFRTIRFEEQYDDNPEDFYADKNQIQQLFLNLLMNSAESIPGEGSITIVTRRMKNQCIVTISDTGCGIREEDLPKIYDPFFTTKPAGKGTGLGLSVSYGIVRQYGGEIRCESKEGKGTTFTVVLPCQKGNESPDAQPAGS